MPIERGDLMAFIKRRYHEYPADWIEKGKTIRVQSLTERERAAIETRMLAQRDGEGGHSYRSVLIAMALVDEHGKRIYSDSDEHLELLDGLDAMATSRLISAIDDHCKMGESVEDREKRQEDAEKNSHAILADVS